MGQDSIADGVKLHDNHSGENAFQHGLHQAKEATTHTPVIGKGVSTISNAYDKFSKADSVGDIAAASGQLLQDGTGFVAGATMDMASFALDPVGWLVSNGLNMLLDLIQPLNDALHFVTGDGPALEKAAGDFVAIGTGFVKLADDFVKTGDEALKDWEGEGGEAAKKALAEFAQGINGIGSAAGSVSDTLKMWSMVMTVIEEVVKAIISELVSWLIYIWLPALAASIVSLGSSVAGAMAASVAKAASALSKITKHLGKLGKLLDKFMGFLMKWSDDLVKQGSKLTKAGKVGMTPGQEKAITGAFAKGVNAQGAAYSQAAKDVFTSVPRKFFDETVKATTGVAPGDLSKGSAYTTKSAYKATDKAITNLKGDHPGNGQSVEETKDDLDI
ncbi:hypothetical protein [Amycolatopsis circi]|uniref:hypothetical protein n=1 Tax=Amycolatopsis circi TaxID=871959 RepID=UPI000E274A01|nr:hypothetical protein [Amycolatopsis circi]